MAIRWPSALAPVLLLGLHARAGEQDKADSPAPRAEEVLLNRQAPDGSWGGDSVFGMDENVRAAVTILCMRALESGPLRTDPRATEAIRRGRDFARRHAARRPEEASYTMYDFSVYSAAFALPYFTALGEEHQPAIEALLECLRINQRAGGGFSYTWRSRRLDSYESFASAMVALSLAEARAGGVAVPEELLRRTLDSVERARVPAGYFGYHIVDGAPRGSYSGNGRLSREGSVVRTIICELALVRAGRSGIDALERAVDDFFLHRGELEKVRARDERTHQGEFDNAPYYFLMGHYFAAQATRELPDGGRRDELRRILDNLAGEDGTWYDSRVGGVSYGTAMGLLTLRELEPRAD